VANSVLIEDFEVIPRLTEYGIPKEIALDIFDAAAGERARVTPSDPSATSGNEMRRWLTRFLRDDKRLKDLGWVSCSHGQLEGIRNDRLKRKLVPLNTDANAGMPSKEPISVSDKGPAAEKVIKGNEDRRQGNFFDNAETDSVPDPLADYDFLYFCVHASDKSLSAEISRPSGLHKSFVAHYSERIMLSQPGERPGLRRPNPVQEDFAEIETPAVVRRG
jgi:hypothetical protein